MVIHVLLLQITASVFLQFEMIEKYITTGNDFQPCGGSKRWFNTLVRYYFANEVIFIVKVLLIVSGKKRKKTIDTLTLAL